MSCHDHLLSEQIVWSCQTLGRDRKCLMSQKFEQLIRYPVSNLDRIVLSHVCRYRTATKYHIAAGNSLQLEQVPSRTRKTSSSTRLAAQQTPPQTHNQPTTDTFLCGNTSYGSRRVAADDLPDPTARTTAVRASPPPPDKAPPSAFGRGRPPPRRHRL